MSRHRIIGTLLAGALALVAFVASEPAAEARHRARVYGPRPRVYGGAAVVLYPRGLYGGIGVFGTRILNQSGGPETLKDGAGVSLFAGWRLNERLALEVAWLGSAHNPSTVSNGYWTEDDYLVLQGMTADARIHLDRSGQLDPYLEGGVGFYLLGREHFGLDAAGTGFQLGGGFEYWVGPHWTLGLRARYHGISMGPPEGGSDNTFISALTAEGSLALHF